MTAIPLRPVPVLLAATLSVGSLLSACADADAVPERADPAVRDSAGVTIVENPAVEGLVAAGWSVDPEPRTTVGVLEGEEAYMLSEVRRPALRSDGSLVLGDGATGQIRAFAPDGGLLWRAGGQGEGPGEYAVMSWIGVLPGDSVAVWDARNRRVTVLDPDGGLARTYSPAAPEGQSTAAPSAVLEGPRFLLSGGASVGSGDFPSGTAPYWPDIAYWIGDTEGSPPDSLTAHKGEERLLTIGDGMIAIRTIYFAREGFVAGAGERVVTAFNGTPEMRVLDLRGRELRRIRWRPTERTPEPDARERLYDHALESVYGADPSDPEVQRQVREQVDAVEIPPVYPVIGDVRIDPTGHLWVQRWQAPWEEGVEAQRWWVFTPEGALLGQVETPADLQVSDITEDGMVGVVRDELDVERVQVHRVARPTGG